MMRQKKYYRPMALFLALFMFSAQAGAVWPLIFGLTGVEQAAVAASITLHTAIAAIGFKNQPSDLTPALVVNLSPKAQVSSGVPAGWAAGANQGDYPIPPSSVAATTTTGNDPQYTTYYTTTLASEVSAAQTANYGAPVTCHTVVTGSNVKLYCNYGSSDSLLGQSTWPQSTSTTCPTGYALSGSTCNILNVDTTSLPNDGVKYIPRTGNTLAPSSRDSDPIPQGVTFPDSNTINYTNQTTGEVVNIHLDSATGTGTITDTVPDSATNSTSVTTVNLSAPAADGTVSVTGVSSSTFSGTGTGQSTTPNSSVSIDTSNLATHGDVSSVGSKVDQLHQDLTGTPTGDGGMGNATTAYNQAADQYKGLIDGITAAPGHDPGIAWSWIPSIPTSTCSAAVISAGGHTMTLDWCPVVAKIRDIFGYVLYIGTGFALFNILVGRRETA